MMSADRGRAQPPGRDRRLGRRRPAVRQTNPLDQTILIAGVQFRVVGVSKSKGAAFGSSLDGFAVIPLGAYMRLFGARQSLTLMVKPTSPSACRRPWTTRRWRCGWHGGSSRTSRTTSACYTSDTLLGIYAQATNGIFAVLVGVVALSLLVGGIVIMNIMLMVVSERTREIGLRKALGARRRDIMSQVLTESVTLSTFGGIVGIMLGFPSRWRSPRRRRCRRALEPWSVVLGIGITAAVGLFFGAYPASRAAALDPIEALQT